MLTKLSDVLKLDKTSSSIKQIDIFLTSHSKDLAYYKALSYKAIILNAIGKSNDAFKILYTIIPNFSSMDDESIVAVCDGIIELTISINRLDQTKKYIDTKAQYIKPSQTKSLYLDKIKYFEAANELTEVKRNLLLYLNDDLDSEERIFAYRRLAKLYYDDHDYEHFREYGGYIISYCEKNLLFNEINEINLLNEQINYESGNYLQAIIGLKKLLEESNTETDMKLEAATLLIRCYIKTNDFHRGSIVESDYEELLSNSKLTVALSFCKASLDLYTKIGHKVSVKLYEDKIAELETTIKKELNQKRKKETKNAVIERNIIDTPEIEYSAPEPQAHSVTPLTKNVRQMYISVVYDKIAGIINTINDVNIDTKFREIFRLYLIELCKSFPIEEAVILFYNHEYTGFHYKKERVYEKRFNQESIVKTLNYQVMNYGDDLFLDEDSNEYVKTNIITLDNYTAQTYGYGMPLYSRNQVIGSICYFGSTRFFDTDLLYEALKIMSGSINVRLLMEIKNSEFVLANNKLFFISDYMSSGYKEEMDGLIHLNKQAIEILGLEENISVSTFESRISASDIAMYKECKNEALTLMILNKNCKYHFQTKNAVLCISERFYPMYENGSIRLLSLIDDISSSDNYEKKLLDMAYTNPLTGLETKSKLYNDLLLEVETKKFALALLDVNNFKLYNDLYGYSFGDDLMKAIGKQLKEETLAEFQILVYHLESDKFALLYKGINDSRRVVSKTEAIIEALTKNVNKINHRLRITMSGGIFRYTKNLTISDPDKILFFAGEGLIDAKNIKDNQNHVCLFDNNTYKKRFFESQLITHVSECIDANQIAISYQGIVSLNDSSYYGYVSRYNLVNYDIDYDVMLKVIEKRDLCDLLDKHLIQQTLKELKSLYDKCKHFVKVLIPIYAKTLNSDGFADFVLKQIQVFHIIPEAVVLYPRGEINPIVAKALKNVGIELASSNPTEVFKRTIGIYFHQFREYDLNSIDLLAASCNTNNILFIMNADKKEDIVLIKSKNYDLVFGDYYKDRIKMKKLIEQIN